MDFMMKPERRNHGKSRILRFAALLLLPLIFTIGVVYAEGETNMTGTGDEDGSTFSYDVQFDANVPETASTKQFLEGTMQKQHFDYEQEQELTTNAYVLPGYEFVGWNTKPDYSGTHYDDGQRVSGLTKTDATVTLYAEWRNQTYNILFKAGNGDLAQKHNKLCVLRRPENLRSIQRWVGLPRRTTTCMDGFEMARHLVGHSIRMEPVF